MVSSNFVSSTYCTFVTADKCCSHTPFLLLFYWDAKRQACHCGPELWQLRDTRNQTFHLLLLGTGCNSIVQEWIMMFRTFFNDDPFCFYRTSLCTVLELCRAHDVCSWTEGSAGSIAYVIGSRTNGFCLFHWTIVGDKAYQTAIRQTTIQPRYFY